MTLWVYQLVLGLSYSVQAGCEAERRLSLDLLFGATVSGSAQGDPPGYGLPYASRPPLQVLADGTSLEDVTQHPSSGND